MDYKKDSYEKSNTDNDILFSKTVKAGKRIYYLDVKRDRRGEYYISMTESKRLKEQGDAMHPVFEKHKIFLYREDVEKFCDAFLEAARFTHERGRVDHPSIATLRLLRRISIIPLTAGRYTLFSACAKQCSKWGVVPTDAARIGPLGRTSVLCKLLTEWIALFRKNIHSL